MKLTNRCVKLPSGLASHTTLSVICWKNTIKPAWLYHDYLLTSSNLLIDWGLAKLWKDPGWPPFIKSNKTGIFGHGCDVSRIWNLFFKTLSQRRQLSVGSPHLWPESGWQLGKKNEELRIYGRGIMQNILMLFIHTIPRVIYLNACQHRSRMVIELKQYLIFFSFSHHPYINLIFSN